MEGNCNQNGFERAHIMTSDSAQPPAHRAHVPEYAKAGVCVVGETAKPEPLASLKVGQNKSKVLHGHSLPRSAQMNEV